MSLFIKFLQFPFRLARLAFANPAGLRQVLGVANNLCEYYFDPTADVSSIPAVPLSTFAENDSQVRAKVILLPSLQFSISTLEALSLAVIVRSIRAKFVFEFGTHRGISTSQLAANIEPEGKVFTLDLPLDFGRHQLEVDNAAEIQVAQYKNKGEMLPADLREHVEFLSADSAQFDPSPYKGKMDVVFVDAAHTFDYVKNDSEKGWAMLRSGGIIVWHDCRPQSPDVVRYLRGQQGYEVKRVEGTTLAFATRC